ncbi:MAG: tcrY [Jatrophihabitans sp.]|nr:tcrY [Jatrophihabitans sp.]
MRLPARVTTAVAAVRRRTARTPLRVKLVAAVLLLVIVALAGSGIAASATMKNYLTGRVDAQLKAAVDPFAKQGGGHGGNEAGDNVAQLPSAYVVETTDATGAIVSGPTSHLVDASESLPQLPRMTGAQSKAAGTRIFTVHAEHSGNRWRVLAAPTTLPDGSSGTVLIAQGLAGVENTVQQLTILLSIIGLGVVLIIAGVGYLIVRASLRPLRAVERTAAQIAAGDLSHRVPDADPRSEVGQLTKALNTMLGNIETAFAERAASEEAARRSEERMRRFIADASHELRTPLTTIRGFAELYRQGAASGEEDVRRVMSRIEGEGKRMGVLVEDLLLLARLDHERPLAREPVDLLALASDAVHDARAVAPTRPIQLEVGATDPPPVVIGDEARLRQVLSNLLANALKYTPDDSPVTVTVGTGSSEHVRGPAVLLTVADHGPGLSTEAAARVFERFYRVDSSRSRSDGGTGLGLAIVAALVAGHGGFVDVHSEPGKGACFRVELPVAETAPPLATAPAGARWPTRGPSRATDSKQPGSPQHRPSQGEEK